MDVKPLLFRFKSFCCVVVLCMNIQCGGEGAAQNIVVKVNPQSPNISLVDLEGVNPNTDIEQNVAAAWFSVRIQVTNNSSQQLVIVGFTLKASNTQDGQYTEVGEANLGPSKFLCNGVACTQSIYELAPTEVKTFGPIYIGGLPDPSKDEVDSFYFVIEGTLEGVLGTINEPAANIRKKFRFTTTGSI